MSGLDNKKKVRAVVRGSFTKYANELDSLLTQPGTDPQAIEVCRDILKDRFNELKAVSSECFYLLLDENTSEADLTADRDCCDGYERRFKELSIKSAKRVSAVPRDEEEVPDRSEHDYDIRYLGKRKFKLPTIQFKQFDGNIRDWLSFWTQFKKVDEDPDIDAADKVEYLIQATVPNSRARNLVNSFPATGENYSKIVDSLKSRFGREDIQVEVYVRELLKLVLNNAVSKAKPDVSTLYDSIETQLRALETLGITPDKYSSMLYPLIESCLPEDLLRVWQRTSGILCAEISNEEEPEESESVSGASCINSLENRLKALLKFLRNEVDNEQRISMASEGFGLHKPRGLTSREGEGKPGSSDSRGVLPTAANLVNQEQSLELRHGNRATCIFCERHHDSPSCFKAQSFSLEKRREILSAKRACYRCLKVGHQSRRCHALLKCVICGKSHVVLMCPESGTHRSAKPGENSTPRENNNPAEMQLSCTSDSKRQHVFLQTLRVKIKGENCMKEVRALIDTGSQRSYILKSTVQTLQLVAKSRENIMHCLFGGVLSEQSHSVYEIHLSQDNGFKCRFDVLDQPKICSEIPSVFSGVWMDELQNLNIEVSDVGQSATIELLIGSDVAGKLYTGRTQRLSCGLTAMETLLGWTIMGKVPIEPGEENVSHSFLNCMVMDSCISNLWELDVLGITDPVANKSKLDLEKAALEFFDQTVQVNEEGRYEVRLPWLDGHPPLPTNHSIGKKRLGTTLKKLKSENVYESYVTIFQEWLQEGVIELVPDSDDNLGHYLPHRPVIKSSSNCTTKIRPVFDASAKVKGKVSLNQCLEKGPNLIELIPEILTRFRR
ncbi:uncharacterized protein LOC126749610, partial [Anthonomus grandis grandis]|uniref:uncharacterized protein LOC126749610 n=1 Tax=Anthonomus grandis grandis TaxID=2921223 RepID=UPI0021666DBD